MIIQLKQLYSDNNKNPLHSLSVGGRGQFQGGKREREKESNLKKDMKGVWKQEDERLPNSVII